MNIDGNALYAFSEGAVIAIVAIVMVFAVLLLIIVLTEIISKVAGKEETKEVATAASANTTAYSSLNINDEDATIACLIASIDLRNETNKQVQVLSVREVK